MKFLRIMLLVAIFIQMTACIHNQSSNVEFICSKSAFSKLLVKNTNNRGVIKINDSLVVWSNYKIHGSSTICTTKNLIGERTLGNVCRLADIKPPYYLTKKGQTDTVYVTKNGAKDYFIIEHKCGYFEKK